MKRREFMQLLAATGVAAILPGLARAAAAPRPRNVVFILADDVGWGDLSCYGAQKIKTPNLDSLARQGMRFTDVHACPLCSATRYGLFSGEYNFRHPTPPVVLAPSAPLSLRRDRPNLASVMKSAGYATGIIGKWHLGLGETQGGQDWNGELKPGPLEIGFDSWFGYATTNDRTPCVYIENHKVVGLDPADPIKVSDARSAPGMTNIIDGVYRHTSMAGGKTAIWKDETMAGVLTGKAVKFIEEHKDKPFFLYFSTNDIHHPVIPDPRFRGTSQAGARGDGVHELDWSVGEVLKTLDRLGLAEDTLLIFTSDNGPTIDDQFRDNNKDPDWDKIYPRGDQAGHSMAGPWKGKKGQQFEGGHREPFIARWPARIKAGQVSDATFSLVDMVATFAAMTGQELPRDAAVDSFNAWPALLDPKPAKPVRDHLVIGLPGMSIRVGDWKLIAAGVGNPGQAKNKAKKKAGKAGGSAANAATGHQLYNLKDDPGENNNVAAQHPDKVKELADLLQKIRESGRSRP